MIRKALLSIIWVFFGTNLQAQPITIAALGDSLTQGYGLEQGTGLVDQLQEWLHAREHEVHILNAGVSGDTTAGGLARVAWTLSDDVDAMIVTLGGNDLLRGIAPETSRQNINGILTFAQDANTPVLLVGMQAPGNYGIEYKNTFDAIYPELSAEFNTVYLDNFFAGFGENQNNPAAIGAWMQQDGIHPNAQGVSLIVDALGPKVVELISQIPTVETD